MSDLEKGLLDEAGQALRWALGDIENLENRLIKLGDPPHLVKSNMQKRGMTWATNVMIRCQVAAGISDAP
jgi:hypothetical protein